jgi:large subunit ribosomal protein L21
MEQNRAEKVIVFKMRRRKGYKNTYGHVHEYTSLKIDKIEYELTQEALTRAVTL